MTDIAKSDNVYYTISGYNPTDEPIVAETDVNLVYPLIPVSSDYQVAISKARIDLSTIPLTRGNIPLKKYQVGIRSGTTEATAYVRQLGVSVGNYAYNITSAGVITKSKYTASGTTTLSSTIDVSAYVGTVGFFLVDDFENFYIGGSAIPSATVMNTLYFFTKAGVPISQLAFTQIQALTIDRQQRIFVGDEAPSGSCVYVYTNANGEGTVALTLAETLTTDFNGSPLAEIQTVCADSQIIVGSGVNTITFYDGVSYEPLTTFTQDAITQLASPSAVMSSYDRYIISDNGVSNNLFYGIASGGSQTVVNMENGTQLVPAVWSASAKMALAENGYGYGVGTDTYTYEFTYNKATGVAGTPSQINNAYAMNNIISCGSACGSGTTVMGNSAGSLLALNSDNLTSNTWFPFDTHFTSSTLPFISMDYQDSTNKIVAVSSDNNLYRSSIPLLPKNFFVGDVSGTQTALTQFGAGWNASGSSNAVCLKTNTTTPYGSGQIIYGFYKNGSTAFALTPNYSGNLGVYKQLLPNQTISATFPVVEANQYYDNNGFAHLCSAGNGYFALSNAFYGTSHPQVFIYSEADGSLVSSITLSATTGLAGNYVMSSINYNSHTYLAITSQVQIFIYDITTPASPTLLCNAPFVPAGYSTQNVSSLIWVANGVSTPYLCALSNGSGATPQALFIVGFTDNTFTAFDNTNAILLHQGTQYTTYIPGLASNPFNGELYAMQGTGSATSAVIDVYKVSTGQLTSTITLPSLLAPNYLTFFYCCDSAYTYSWTEITQVVSKASSCVAVSEINCNNLYILDTAGTPWKGTLVSGNIASWSAMPTIAGTYASINVYELPKSLYSGTVYAYGLTTGQTLHGSQNVGMAELLSATRNDVSGEFLVSTSGGSVISYAPADLSVNWTTTSITNTNLIWTKNSSDIDAGAYDIFTYATLIQAINDAYIEAYAKLPAGTYVEPPSMSLDYATGLLTLHYSSDYAPTPQSISKGFLMNKALLQLCFFQSTVDTLDATLNLITLVGGSTSKLQGSKSIYQFNQLDKIVFISNTMYVNGSYFGNNNTNNIIQDIDVPTSETGYMDNVGQVLYFQPTFLRPFMLASNLSLTRVQVSINYVYLDGTQYPLLVAPYNNWSAKLILPRRY